MWGSPPPLNINMCALKMFNNNKLNLFGGKLSSIISKCTENTKFI